MKYLKLFENYSNDIDQAQAQLAELDSLRDFALLTADEYRQQSSALMKTITAHNRKLLKKANSEHQPYSDEWYQAISEYPSLAWLVELKDLPEYSEFIAAGLHPVSSVVQLGNRTIVFAKDPNYKSGESYAIGLFSSINAIRRLTPDTIRFGRRQPTLDQKVKELDGSLTPLQFFKDGMRWVLDNLVMSSDSFPNKKTASAEIARNDERSKLLDQIKQAFSSAGIQSDDSLEIIPIDGLRGNMGDIRRLASLIKRSIAKGGPLEIPITQWNRYTQMQVDAMSKYPNVVWTIGPSQIVIEANNTRNWNLKPTEPNIDNLSISSALAADDILRKFETAGVKSIKRLTYPIDQIDLADYPSIEVHSENNVNRY